MYLIADASGPIGRPVIEQLLGQGQLLRILTSDAQCRNLWRGRGVDVNEGDPRHASSWSKVLVGIDTVILVAPPYTTESGSMREGVDYQSAIVDAMSRLKMTVNVILVSAIGAEEGIGWAKQLGELERQVIGFCPNVTIIRAAFLMENLAPALSMAKHHSVFPCFFYRKNGLSDGCEK